MFWKQSLQDLWLLRADPACKCLRCEYWWPRLAPLACLAFSFCNSSTFGLLKGKVFFAKGYENWQQLEIVEPFVP